VGVISRYRVGVNHDETVESARRLRLRDPSDRRWSQAIDSLLPTQQDCAAFVEWASHHPRWLHNVADASDKVCAKPREAAIAILSEIVDELLGFSSD